MEKYDSYKNSGVEWIGQIPSDWECIRLGMLGDFSSSGIDKKSNEDETPVRMVNYTDIIQSRKYYPIQTGEKEYMRVTTPQSKFKEHKLERGDMVFIPSSETHEDLGYSSLIDFDEEDIVYSYHILRYKTKKPVYHYYKKYLINHHSVLNQFSSECKGTTRQIIGRDVFNSVRVVLPPISEQQQIVTFLDTKTSLIDSLIEKTQQKIELLKEKRTSLINEVVTKGLNPNVEMKDSGVEWIGKIPKGWRIGKLYQYSEMSNGSTPSRVKPEYWENGTIPWMSSGEINKKKIRDIDGRITQKGFENSSTKILPIGTVMMGLNGQGKTKGTVGILEIETTCNQSLCGMIFKDDMYPMFSYYFLDSQYYHIRGLVGEGQREGISVSFLGRYPLVVPPISEQQQIVKYLDEQTELIDKTISIEEKRIELLKEYRQSLISEVVTGKRKVVV